MITQLTLDTVRALLSPRADDAHKGSFGHVLVLAGSRGFTGAAKLATEAAYRAGAGLVTLGFPQPLVSIVAPELIEAMWLALPATKNDSFSVDSITPALAASENKQAVVLGPGISTHDETRRFVIDFLKQNKTPLLIDADGLNAISINAGVIASASAPIVVTPHPGEMARLAGISTEHVQRDRVGVATQVAMRQKCVVVLKGHETVIANTGGEYCVNTTGNPGMATGGTGDVLSGVIGGLMAQGLALWDAARIGVFAHGLAGDIAARAHTRRGMIARDVLAALPYAWQELEGH